VAQVLLHGPGEVAEPIVVGGLERQLARLDLCAPAVWRSGTASRPRSELGIASVTSTSTKRLISDGGPSKFTQRLFSVRPASCRASFFDGRSTSTRCTEPTMARLIACALASMRACSRSRRACFTSWATSSGSEAAGVPGRRL
jgi:hypothetical protein